MDSSPDLNQRANAPLPPSLQLQQLHLAAASPSQPPSGDAFPTARSRFAAAPEGAAAPTNSTASAFAAAATAATAAPVVAVTVSPSLDLDSEDMFPTLSASSTNSGAKGSWGGPRPAASLAATGPTPAPPRRDNLVTEILDLPMVHPPRQKELGEKGGVGELVRQVMKKTGTQIDVSTASQTRTMTFLIRGKPESARQAKRELMATLASRVTVTLQVPSFVRPFILGTRGKTLNAITARTGTKIHIPRRDEGPPSKGDHSHDDEEDYDAVSDITITGDLEGVSQAKAEIEKIVNEKTSKRVARLTHIPTAFFPLLAGAHNALATRLAESHQVKVRVPFVLPLSDPIDQAFGTDSDAAPPGRPEPAIVVSGEKDAVDAAVEEINELYEQLNLTTRTIMITIPKRQHRFLVGPKGATIQEVLEITGCSMELAPAADPSESVVIRGPENRLMDALTLVMEKAGAIQVDTLDLLAMHATADPVTHARRVLRYLAARSKLKKLETEHSAQIFLPRAPHREADYVVEVVTKDILNLVQARQALVELLKSLPPTHFGVCHVEPHTHGHLIGRNGANVQRLQASRGVDVVFPERDEQSAEVVLVYESNPRVDCFIHDRRRHELAIAELLREVGDELVRTSREAAELVVRTVIVPTRFHRLVIGPKGTTLAQITGEDTPVTVNIGANPHGGKAARGRAVESDEAASDAIMVKGPADEVDRIVAEIERIARDAEEDERRNSHVEQLRVPQEHLPHIIGRNGVNITRLKDEHQVRVDIENKAGADTPRELATVTVRGTPENARAFKAAFQAVVDRLTDSTTATVAIDRRHHPALIGSQGRLVRQLEEKHNVFLKFPRGHGGRTDEEGDETSGDHRAQGPNDIVVKGGRKGVEAAKRELLDLARHEEANNQSVTFTIPAHVLPHVVGRSGAHVNEIKNATGTRIDLGTASGDSLEVPVTVRGTSKGIKEAQARIEAVANEQASQVTVHLDVAPEHHRTLIGAGGAKIRDLVKACGGNGELVSGPGSCRVFFPRKNATGDEARDVTIKGDRAVVEKVQRELESIVNELGQRVCVTVHIPVSEHPLIIGRGGATLREIQARHQVEIDFASTQRGRPAKLAGDSSPEFDPTLVKIHGRPEHAEAAAQDLQNRVRMQTSLTVPLYVHQIVGGSHSTLWRALRNDLNVYIDPANKAVTGEPTTYAATHPADPEDTDPSDPRPDPVFETGTIDWVLKGTGKVVEKALARCQKATTDLELDYIKLPSLYHRHVIGKAGANVTRIRKETGCQLEFPKKSGPGGHGGPSPPMRAGSTGGPNTVVPNSESEWVALIGSPESIENAKVIIDEVIEEADY
ncbi:hypothetical protein IWQ60_007126 [Tieghemiomyces parasiticus]|uniref:K Homology domain-containing protein n=1 Tax=Tieghemiomyces parasiticus TaxID=78921 RepID=A0A9W8DVQ9_9FUNG|nr:hypothetical protein IWQ60_007126 [Tieghemiomyces parasiticus]